MSDILFEKCDVDLTSGGFFSEIVLPLPSSGRWWRSWRLFTSAWRSSRRSSRQQL